MTYSAKLRELVDFVPDQSIEFLNGKISHAKAVIAQVQSMYDSIDGKLEGKEGKPFYETLAVVKAVRSKLMGVMDKQRSCINEYNKYINIKQHLIRTQEGAKP